MKLFPIIRKNFEILGIILQHQQQSSFNKQIFFISFSYGLSCISYSLFLFYGANTFWEYTNNIYTNSATILIVICFVIINFRMKNLSELIDNCEKYIENNESLSSKAIYDKTNQQIEKWCKIIYSAVAKITPICIILLRCIVCFFVYSTTDLQNDAFELPLLMW